MRTTLKDLGIGRFRKTQEVSLGTTGGLNLLTSPEFMGETFATKLNGFIVRRKGRIESLKGSLSIYETADGEPITFLKKYSDTLLVFAHGTKLKSFNLDTQAVVTITSSLTATTKADGGRYGDTMYFTNGVEIGYCDPTTPGFTSLPAQAIKADAMFFFGGRMYLGKGTQIQWSQVDSGATIPFITAGEWTVSGSPPTPESSNSAYSGQFGSINSFGVLGGQVVAFFDNGKLGFRIESVEAGVGLAQSVTTDFEREDFGGERGAISTPYGIFYVNEGGLWQMLSGGSTNQPFSEQDNELSQILGEDLLEDLDLSNSSIVYDIKRNLVIFTAAYLGSINNTLFIYDPQSKAFSQMSNVYANRIIRDGRDIYIGSSIDTKLLQLFQGNSNDGNDIPRVFEYEVPLAVDALYELNNTTIKGFMSAGNNTEIAYDIYDKFGVKSTDFLQLQLTNDIVNATPTGFSSGFTSGFGSVAENEKAEFRAEIDTPITEFSRLIFRIKTRDKSQYDITWISLGISQKGENDTNQNLIKI